MKILFEHQFKGVDFLRTRKSAMLCDEMGLGKSRQALCAAQWLYGEKKIDRVLILAPAAVRYSWRTEIDKLEATSITTPAWLPCIYDPKKQIIYGENRHEGQPLPVLVLSYSLLPQKRHAEALKKWCEDGSALLICDESSFLKNRTAKQTKSAANLARCCVCCWLLTGTPVANSPLDLYGQALVMAPNGSGPLRGFTSWWQFQARYAVLKQMNMGAIKFKQVVGYQNIGELTKRFAPYVLRREKKDCLDLPEKTYAVREVQLTPGTWKIYQELRKEAMLCLPDTDERPEPNAAVRILRLCQLTSGHVGGVALKDGAMNFEEVNHGTEDVSSEKLSWLVEQILDGELSNERALIVWCRWRRERERLNKILTSQIPTFQIFGGQNESERNFSINAFGTNDLERRVLLAQPHAGGFGLNLTAASTAVFLSNDFSHTTRVQAEDRIHRIGQHSACLYVDVLATGPNGQHTVDHHIVECLRAKKDLAVLTCKGWRRALND